MTNAWISRASSNLTAVAAFYEAMGCECTSPTLDDAGGAKMEVRWPSADVPVVFTARPSNWTSSDFTVADFEAYLLTTHRETTSAYDGTFGFATCGFDKWLDNHYGTSSSQFLDFFADAIRGLPSSLPTSYWTPRQWEGSNSMMK